MNSMNIQKHGMEEKKSNKLKLFPNGNRITSFIEHELVFLVEKSLVFSDNRTQNLSGSNQSNETKDGPVPCHQPRWQHGARNVDQRGG